MTHSELNALIDAAHDSAVASDARPLDARLAFLAFRAVCAAFDAAVALDASCDVGLAVDADYREAVLASLGGAC